METTDDGTPAGRKEHMQEMTARMETNQENSEANRKANQAKTDVNLREMRSTVNAIEENLDATINSMRAW
jgi:hypothetical protein